MIFQDPYSSLNPRKSVGQIVAEPFTIHRTEKDVKRACRSCSRASGSARSTTTATRTSSRAASASGSASPARSRCNPKLIVCDEPVSALDVSVQAQILNLLKELQRELDLTYIFISHDLSVIRQISDRIAVMYLGRVVEIGESELLYEHPRHPYTAALLSAVPRAEVNGGVGGRKRMVLGGRRAVARQPARGLRLPPALPALPDRALRRRDARAAPLRRRPRGGVPLPDRALAADGGGVPAPCRRLRAGRLALDHRGALTPPLPRRLQSRDDALASNNGL